MGGLEGGMGSSPWLNELRDHAIEVNEEWAERLGIKPVGGNHLRETIGHGLQLVDTSSVSTHGTAKYYVRTVRQDDKDPITQFLIDQGRQRASVIGKETAPRCSTSSRRHRRVLSAPRTSDTLAQLNLAKLYGESWATQGEHVPPTIPTTVGSRRASGSGTTGTR